MRAALLAVSLGTLSLPGCAPKASPMAGTVAPMPVPRAELAPGHRTIRFTWTYADPEYQLRGDGVARIAAPDSVRMDFFLAGGLGSGRALLIGDRLDVPGVGFVERFLPPPPLLWAALGRLHLPPAADTTVRLDGDTLRAEIGREPRWRVAFAGGDLRGIQRIDDGRLAEWVRRTDSNVSYRNTAARRSLDITIIGTDPGPAFDATIWR